MSKSGKLCIFVSAQLRYPPKYPWSQSSVCGVQSGWHYRGNNNEIMTDYHQTLKESHNYKGEGDLGRVAHPQ